MKTFDISIVDETHYTYSVEASTVQEARSVALAKHIDGTDLEREAAYEGVYERLVDGIKAHDLDYE